MRRRTWAGCPNSTYNRVDAVPIRQRAVPRGGSGVGAVEQLRGWSSRQKIEHRYEEWMSFMANGSQATGVLLRVLVRHRIRSGDHGHAAQQ